MRNAKKNLNDKIKHRDKTIVLFYASWCPFSRRFLPICEEYSIEYYPTVILFRKGKVHKRLDAQPGIGLNKEQLKELTEG